jgi:acetyl esterase/lipase
MNKLILLSAAGVSALAFLTLVLTLVWSDFRGFIGRLPGLFIAFPLLLALIALAVGLIIYSGYPWPISSFIIESSLWITGFSAGTLIFNLIWLFVRDDTKTSLLPLAIGGSVISGAGLVLALLPSILLLFTGGSLDKEMKQVLGQDYEARIPTTLKTGMRSSTFNPIDYILGIRNASGSFNYVQDLVYHSVDDQKVLLDVYHPSLAAGESGPKNPALLVVHGGGWEQGNKYEVMEFNNYMAARGWVVFSVDYRLAPTYPYPAPQEDLQCALHFIAKNGEKYGADINRLAVLGRSAGGTLALTAAYDKTPLPGAAACGQNLPEIKAAVAYYPPTDLERWYSADKSGRAGSLVMGHTGGTPTQKPEEYRLSSPVTYATQKLPPTLLVQSGRDQYDLGVQSPLLADKLREAGNKVVLFNLPWAGHAFDFVFDGLSNQPVLYYTERFLAYYVSNPS